MKKILVFHPIGKWIGGGETGLIDLLKNIDNNKYTFHVVFLTKVYLAKLWRKRTLKLLLFI